MYCNICKVCHAHQTSHGAKPGQASGDSLNISSMWGHFNSTPKPGALNGRPPSFCVTRARMPSTPLSCKDARRKSKTTSFRVSDSGSHIPKYANPGFRLRLMQQKFEHSELKNQRAKLAQNLVVEEKQTISYQVNIIKSSNSNHPMES